MILNTEDIFYQKTTFGDLLRRLRREKGLSLLNMMERTGIYYNRLSEYESGLTKPDTTKIYKLCDALEVDKNMRSRMVGLARLMYDLPAESVMRSAYVMPDPQKSKLSAIQNPFPSFVKSAKNVRIFTSCYKKIL